MEAPKILFVFGFSKNTPQKLSLGGFWGGQATRLPLLFEVPEATQLHRKIFFTQVEEKASMSV